MGLPALCMAGGKGASSPIALIGSTSEDNIFEDTVPSVLGELHKRLLSVDSVVLCYFCLKN